MIGIKDLENEAGNTEFLAHCKAAERYIKSQGYAENAEDLAQEVSIRVLQKISEKENFQVDAGYFIGTAKRVLKEEWRRKGVADKRFYSPQFDDESSSEKPLDSDLRLLGYEKEKDRKVFNDCFMECFNELTLEQQILLWRYSFDERKHQMDTEEPSSYQNFFGTILDSLREIRQIFLPLQAGYKPLDKDARLKVCRLRKPLRLCLKNCVSRKKGFN